MVRQNQGAPPAAKYSVLLPTYNERENLPLMVFLLDEAFTKAYVTAASRSHSSHALHTKCSKLGFIRLAWSYCRLPMSCSGLEYEIVIVEDSSPDGTYEAALALRETFGADHIKILKRPGKLGLGSAYIDGLSLVTGDFVFIMDADLSHHVRLRNSARSPLRMRMRAAGAITQPAPLVHRCSRRRSLHTLQSSENAITTSCLGHATLQVRSTQSLAVHVAGATSPCLHCQYRDSIHRLQAAACQGGISTER